MPSSEPLLIKAANAMDLKWAYVDTHLVYRKVSAQYCKWHQTDESEVLGRPVSQVMSNATVRRLNPYWEKALAGDVVSFETQLFRAGSDTLSFVKATFIPNIEAGKVIGFYAFYLDHTAETKAINTLRKLHQITSDSSLSLDDKIQKILQLGVQVFDLPIGIISEIVDEKYTVKYAVSPENAINPDDHFDLSGTYCVHTLAAEGPLAFHHAGESRIKNHPCYQDFGLESYIGIPIYVNNVRYGTLNFSSPDIHPVPFNEYDFSLIELLSQWVGNELSRYDFDNELKFQKTLLESMSRQARIGTWELDLIEQKLYWSDMTREILEVPSDYTPGLETTFEFYKEGESRESVRKAINQSIKTGQSWSLDVQVVTAKGHCIWVNAMGQAEFRNGQSVKLFGSFQDINQRVNTRLELENSKKQAELAMKSKGEFLANMSHEIRTPMNGVIGMLGSVLKTELNEDQHDKLNLAFKSAESLLVLINDILDFSKVDAGKLELDPQSFSLSTFLSEFLQSMKASALEKDLTLELIDKDIEVDTLYADQIRIKQILTNLVGNAIKFTRNGGVKIKASSHNEKDAVQCRFEIIDTGIGIEADKLNHLFDAFTQADASTTRNYGGTGLGLAISKQLCELMNGEITVKSQEGKGSEFLVTLYVDESNSSLIEEGQALNTESKLFNQEKVLLVEDNFINQEVAKDQLNDMNLSIDVAENGLKAIEALISKGDGYYQLILMDCQMPLMDGYETSREIRKGVTGSLNSKLPIIAMTANAMKGDKEACLEAGMTEYLSKPLSPERLNSMLARFLP